MKYDFLKNIINDLIGMRYNAISIFPHFGSNNNNSYFKIIDIIYEKQDIFILYTFVSNNRYYNDKYTREINNFIELLNDKRIKFLDNDINQLLRREKIKRLLK